MSGMRLPSFIKTRSIKQFEFTPRYYNETKEAMEERKARIKAELNRDSLHVSKLALQVTTSL